MISEMDVRDAARRVVTLSRGRLEKVVGVSADRSALSRDNPYIEVFAALYRFALEPGGNDATAATQLEVANTVLGNPLYGDDGGAAESPLLILVMAAVSARRKANRGETLTNEEAELLNRVP